MSKAKTEKGNGSKGKAWSIKKSKTALELFGELSTWIKEEYGETGITEQWIRCLRIAKQVKDRKVK